MQLVHLESEDRSQKTDDRSQMTEVRRRKAEDRRMKFNMEVMEAKFKFEKLIIWQMSMEFGEAICLLTKKFPDDENFNLSSQIRRAVDSIALNISEGSIGQSNQEFKRFIGFSIRSLAEVVTCLKKAHSRNYVTEEEFEKNYEYAFNLMNMLVAFRKKIK